MENPFKKSEKGPKKGYDDEWEPERESDVNGKDDHSCEVLGDDRAMGDDKVPHWTRRRGLFCWQFS